MTCNRTEQIHRYHDGELAGAEQRAVELHLNDCASCRALLDDLRQMSQLLRRAPLAEVPAQTMAELCALPLPARDAGILRLASCLTATAAAVLLMAVLSWPTDRTEKVTQTATLWEMAAVTPPTETQDDARSDFMVLAKWMADDLAVDKEGDLR